MPPEIPPRSPLGLIVLLELMAEPMHVYRMQKLIEGQGKHRVVNVRSRATLYQTVERLVRLGLVQIEQTVRGDARPDRTVYAISDAGRVVAREWLRQMLRGSDGEYPEFIAAVSMIFALAPEDALEQLEARAERLASELDGAESELAAHPGLPRVFLLEEEYRRAVLRAELGWITGIIDDLLAGHLAWDDESLRKVAAEFTPPDEGR